MLVFPQLRTGALSQYPLRQTRSGLTLTNGLADGNAVSWVDSVPRMNRWQLTARDLTDTESESIQSLFAAVEGRLGTFTFIDPTANILAYSEDLTKPCWSKDPMLQFTASVTDPYGGQRATRVINAGQNEQAVSQTLPLPASFTYAFSVYGRSAGGSMLSLQRSSSSASQRRTVAPADAWTRWSIGGALTGEDESVTFSLVLPAGASVDLFGIQAEPQPAPSAYKQSGARNGVYSHSRFDDDVLRLVSDGPNQHRYDLRIVARD